MAQSAFNASLSGPVVDGIPIVSASRPAARAVAVADVDLSTFTVGSIVDGVTFGANQRLLCTNQSDARENGVWVTQLSGAAKRPVDWSRELPIYSGTLIAVLEGDRYAGTLWLAEPSATIVTPTLSPDAQSVTVTQLTRALESYTTAARPAANLYPAGASIFDTTLARPLWSDGAVWRYADGTAA